MPTPTKGARLGGSPSHQRLILANLATNLFEHGQVTTTETKARRLRPYAEQLITKAKHDSVANRRRVVRSIRDKDVLHVLFTEIGPRYVTRPGGYTRITKLGPRKGDNAPMAVIELVEEREFEPSAGSGAASPSAGPAAGAEAEAAPAEPEAAPAEPEAAPAEPEAAPAEAEAAPGEAEAAEEHTDRD